MYALSLQRQKKRARTTCFSEGDVDFDVRLRALDDVGAEAEAGAGAVIMKVSPPDAGVIDRAFFVTVHHNLETSTAHLQGSFKTLAEAVSAMEDDARRFETMNKGRGCCVRILNRTVEIIVYEVRVGYRTDGTVATHPVDETRIVTIRRDGRHTFNVVSQ